MAEKRRRYTHDQKAKAVAHAEINGFQQASEAMGIPESNIRYWWDQPKFADLREKTREDKRDGYRVIVTLAQDRLIQLIPSMEPRDLTILLGVAQDKDLLLSGDPTSRSETKDTTHDLDPDTRRRITDWLDKRLDPDAGPTDVVPEDTGAEVR